MVPEDARTTSWASFDGRHRIELQPGEFVTVSLSRFPMPTVCAASQSGNFFYLNYELCLADWFESLTRCLCNDLIVI